MPYTDWIAEFKEKFFSLDANKREEAIKLKDQYLPPKIYSYVRVGKHFDENISDILGKDERFHHPIHLTHPSKFNDPYDTLILTTTSYPLRQYIVKTLKYRLEKFQFVENASVEFRSELNRLYDIFLKNGVWSVDDFTSELLTEDISRKVYNTCQEIIQTYSKEMSRYGIKSFSTKFDSMLMWSHYAGSHTGFCFEYDISQLSSDHDVRKYLYPVIYEEKIEGSNLSKIDNVENPSYIPLIFIERSMSKSSEWTYENEWRFIKKWHLTSDPNEQNELALYPFPLYPSTVYIGHKTSPLDIAKLKASLQLYGIPIQNTKFEYMGLGINSYKLVHYPEWR